MTSFRDTQLSYLENFLKNIDVEEIINKHGTPLFLINSAGVKQKYKEMINLFPMVKPHFAIKSSPIPKLLEIYKKLDAHLDVATDGEIDILESINYPPSKLIHTHPHKSEKSMKKAYDYGIRTFVLDDIAELPILEPFRDNINVLLRISFENDHASINLSYKFGVDINDAFDFIKELLRLKFNVIGTSFHVGSQMNDTEPYESALSQTAKLYKLVSEKLNHDFKLVDIGGGFPTPYTEDVIPLKDFASAINPILAEHFKNVNIISEPGRALINENIILLTKVISKTVRKGKDWLFLDDGVYGSFSDILSGHSQYLLFSRKELSGEKADRHYIVAGPTCDSIDVILEDCLLPEINRDDIIIVPNMGAYSYALASEFNSIPRAGVLVI